MKNGKTTRLVDRYIQELFEKRITYVYEDRFNDSSVLTDECFKRFKKRMRLEHKNIFFKSKYVFVDGFWSYKVELL